MPLALSFQNHMVPSASDFSASKSQVDKKWRKQMVGLKFLFARLAWKESFHMGCVCSRSFVLHRGKLTFQIEAPTGSCFWPQSLQKQADGSGNGFQRAWAERHCLPTFHRMPPCGPSRVCFSSCWMLGCTALSPLGCGLASAPASTEAAPQRLPLG